MESGGPSSGSIGSLDHKKPASTEGGMPVKYYKKEIAKIKRY